MKASQAFILSPSGARGADTQESCPLTTARTNKLLATFVCAAALTWWPAARVFAGAIDKYVGRPVTQVEFSSEDFIDVTAMKKAVAVAVGKPLDPSDVRQSIATLYQTREFSQIEVDASLGNAGLVISFKLRPNFFFGDFRLRGDPVLRSSISSLVSLPLGEAYAPKTVEQVQQKVQEALREAGYYQAEVVPDVQFLSKMRLVTVEYLVNAGQRATISGIQISGSPLLERSEILQTMKLRPGKYFDSEALKRDFERLRKLYSDRGFLNATLRLEKLDYSQSSNSVEIQMQIESGSFVYIELTGGKISKKQLRELVPIYEEASIDVDLIEEGRRNIEDHFQRKGFFDVTVQKELIEVPSENAYQVNYTIDRGKRQKVVSIDFFGATHFGRNQLLQPLATRMGGLTSRGTFSGDLLKQDAETLKNLYLRDGFEQVSVEPSFKKDPSGVNIAATFTIQEGPRTIVSEVEIQGNDSIAREDLVRGLNLTPGGPFSQALLQDDRRLVESRYLDRGFTEVKVEPVTERVEGNRVKIVYTLSEGEHIRVDDIHIIGSRQTRNKVISRNITFHEGDPLSQEQLLTSQQQLYGLGLFNRVDIVPVNVKQGDAYRPVIIRVEDGSPIILGYGGGYQDREGPRGTIEISHNNLFGLARSISFRTRASFREQRGQITYKEPRLFNRDLDSYITLYAENTDAVSFSTTTMNAAVQVLKRFGRVDNYFVRYNFETVDLSDIRVNPLATGQEDLGTLKLSAFSTAWLRDTRDDPIEPERGFFNSLNLSVASRLYGSEANLLSFFGQHQTYRRVSKGAVLALSFRLGLIGPYGRTSEVPISERFFAGGSTTLRGFDLDLAGPLDPETNKPLGGNALVTANAELRIPVTGNFALAPFYDTGNVFARLKDIHLSNFSNTLGLGMRYKTPFGPLRVDVGFNLSPPLGFPTRQIFFTIGNPF
ncbi:MAG: outer membrane protein assembly factor BamA [Acidobacteria bacterium]|nr:outer membrane protein assembly factor BamA [Acidobacteriota bacterium]MCI0624226.1 outer membrane protein assembly factor BamA [Acidobacteriota bacterium]MCI0721264.1 outer membrane protein assembly factor BamA [Acidobacteriota bacterium]